MLVLLLISDFNRTDFPRESRRFIENQPRGGQRWTFCQLEIKSNGSQRMPAIDKQNLIFFCKFDDLKNITH